MARMLLTITFRFYVVSPGTTDTKII